MFLFVRVRNPGAQGKNREPGLQKNSVRNFIGRRAVGRHLKATRKRGFFCALRAVLRTADFPRSFEY
ncbi:MAG: hypothetical protein EGQ14_02980 [Spirochaetia bacterium]|nr:hypothetical protein [Spirochaetia bacterium]